MAREAEPCAWCNKIYFILVVCQHFLLWFDFAIESSPFRQVPSLGVFPSSLGWLFIGAESGWDSVNHRKLLRLGADVCSCTLVMWPGSICLQAFSFQTLLCWTADPWQCWQSQQLHVLTGFVPLQRERGLKRLFLPWQSWAGAAAGPSVSLL